MILQLNIQITVLIIVLCHAEFAYSSNGGVNQILNSTKETNVYFNASTTGDSSSSSGKVFFQFFQCKSEIKPVLITNT